LKGGLFRLTAEQRYEFIVDDLDHQLAGGYRLQDLGPYGLFLYGVDEIFDGLEVDVGAQKDDADFTESFGNVFFGQL
jgi:hypothetical protein